MYTNLNNGRFTISSTLPIGTHRILHNTIFLQKKLIHLENLIGISSGNATAKDVFAIQRMFFYVPFINTIQTTLASFLIFLLQCFYFCC